MCFSRLPTPEAQNHLQNQNTDALDCKTHVKSPIIKTVWSRNDRRFWFNESMLHCTVWASFIEKLKIIKFKSQNAYKTITL